MTSFKHWIFGIVILAALCTGHKWIGPSQTAFESLESTTATLTSDYAKPTLLRRVTSALSICGFESGRAQQPISCDDGYKCDFSTLGAGANAILVYGCCNVTSSCSTLYTGCSNYQVTSLSLPNVLTCSANMPYCQYFTFPEVDAVAYGCGLTSYSTWRTISLTISSTTSSSNNTSKFSSTSTSQPQPSTLSSPTPTQTPPSTSAGTTPTPPTSSSIASGSVQDLTLPEKVGIGIGSSGALIFITVGIYWRRRIRKRKAFPPLVEEKSPTSKITEVQEQEPAVEAGQRMRT